jgi:hypothetical protein
VVDGSCEWVGRGALDDVATIVISQASSGDSLVRIKTASGAVLRPDSGLRASLLENAAPVWIRVV